MLVIVSCLIVVVELKVCFVLYLRGTMVVFNKISVLIFHWLISPCNTNENESKNMLITLANSLCCFVLILCILLF